MSYKYVPTKESVCAETRHELDVFKNYLTTQSKHSHPDTTFKIENGIKHLYATALKHSRDLDKNVFPKERFLENMFYEAVDNMIAYHWSPSHIKDILKDGCKTFVDTENYNISYGDTTKLKGRRESIAHGFYECHTDGFINACVDDAFHKPLSPTQKAIRRMSLWMFKTAADCVLSICPMQKRERRMLNMLDQKQHDFDFIYHSGTFNQIPIIH